MIINNEIMSYRKIKEGNFTLLYDRNKNKVNLGDELEEILFSGKFPISDQKTFVSFINDLYISVSKKNIGVLNVIDSFMNEIINLTYLKSIRNMISNTKKLSELYLNQFIKEKTIKLLSVLAITISDIIVTNESNGLSKIYLERKINENKYTLDFDNESDGTKALLYLMPDIFNKMENGGVLIVDEIDAHLHPKLTKAIIELFTSKENKKAQLVFTSHDILNMTNELFRRDEIWFVVKDKNYSSNLIALTDFVNYKGEKIRKDAKYSKQYLEGKYGADPFIQKGAYWYGKNT